MVEYYNLSKISEASDNMGLFHFLSSQTNYVGFPLFMLGVIFIIPLMLMLQRGDDITMSVHYSSLFTALASIIFYISGIIVSSIFILIPIIIYVVTLAMRWYNKDR